MSYEYDKSTYREDLFIDKFNLDLEWEKQPMLFDKWAGRWAESVERRDRAKQYVDVAKAELYSKIRAEPKIYGLSSKPTEGAVNSYIITTKKYKSAFADFLAANKDVNVLSIAKEAMNHKKRALEYVSQLMLGGFFARPNIKSEAREQVEQAKSSEVKKHIKDSDRMRARSQKANT